MTLGGECGHKKNQVLPLLLTSNYPDDGYSKWWARLLPNETAHYARSGFKHLQHVRPHRGLRKGGLYMPENVEH